MNYYSVLGILPSSTPDDVKQAYLRLAKKYHPDRNNSPNATAKMAEINLAYETLRDPEKRKAYDLKSKPASKKVREHLVKNQEEATVEERREKFPGKCTSCNFVNTSGVFVCSVCGTVFDPHASGNKLHQDSRYEELSDPDDEADSLSEIIRCPRCNEINRFSRGFCWQCGLQFEIEELV